MFKFEGTVLCDEMGTLYDVINYDDYNYIHNADSHLIYSKFWKRFANKKVRITIEEVRSESQIAEEKDISDA